jgi:aspartate/methionine/tyrosine aminotransferase
MSNVENWISDRVRAFDSSGIRRMFDLSKDLKDPIDLSIGQPHYPVPESVKMSLIKAIQDDHNNYALTQGLKPFREKLQSHIDDQFGDTNRKVFVCSGTSGGLVLAIQTVVNPGDEVIIFDPYFVMYPALIGLAGGMPVIVDTYPDFRINIDAIAKAITPRTKAIIVNTPNNPTGKCLSESEARALGELANEHNVCIISDEIYSMFVYDQQHISPASFNKNTIVVDGFSKSHAMTGLRLAYVHAPDPLIQQMTKLQQFTFVCAPHPVQWAGIDAMDVNMDHYVEQYAQKRDRIFEALRSHYEIARPDGAFYLFAKAPGKSAREFTENALQQNLLLIPGTIFSRNDTHFRISYAVNEQILDKGIEILKNIA